MAVAAVASYAIDMIHLVNKNNKQKDLINKVIGMTDIHLSNSQLGFTTSFGLSLRF